jgi:hypothetical protein
MANIKISQLPSLGVLSSPDQFPVVSGGSTYNVTANVMQSYILGSSITTTGTITVNSSNATTAIINGAGNGVGNIGSSTTYFNTVFAKATSAQYADLAENYLADSKYPPGTVVSFGGTDEVTQCNQDACTAIAGIVSTQPAHLMNSQLAGENVVAVALVGRVPCRVQGSIAKGSLMVSAGNGLARAEKSPAPGTIIGRAIESFDGDTGTIEIAVGRA